MALPTSNVCSCSNPDCLKFGCMQSRGNLLGNPMTGQRVNPWAVEPRVNDAALEEMRRQKEDFLREFQRLGGIVRDKGDKAAPVVVTTAPVATAPVVAPGIPFSSALELLKQGMRLARLGWNGKGMFVYLVPAASYPAQTGAAKKHFGEGAMVPYNAYFALKGVDGAISTWQPSVGDCLAEDWFLMSEAGL